MDPRNIGGMSMKGGRKDKFYFCLFEYYAEKKRWFLKSLLQVKDEDNIDGNDAIRSWIESYNIKELVVDFPLTSPACHNCSCECPGIPNCPVEEVKAIDQKMEDLLNVDRELREKSPKNYEKERNRDDEVDYSRNILEKEAHQHILSRSFKRRLKKGYLPYWNRPLDFWIWKYYYDQLLELFKVSFDSFGSTSLMVLSRFSYLKRHFPAYLGLFESNIHIIMIELLRKKIINKNDIKNLNDLGRGAEARLNIIKRIEKKLSIFIYDHDLEILVKNSRAFDSFLLALSGQHVHLEKIREIPDWAHLQQINFVVPHF